MADKLENLVSRLEKTTVKLEAIQTDKLESLVNRLEKALSKVDPQGASGVVQGQSQTQVSSTPSQSTSQPQTQTQTQAVPAFNVFDTVYSELEEKAIASENEDLVNLVLNFMCYIANNSSD